MPWREQEMTAHIIFFWAGNCEKGWNQFLDHVEWNEKITTTICSDFLFSSTWFYVLVLTHPITITPGACEILRFLDSSQHWNQLNMQTQTVSDHILIDHNIPLWNNDSSRNMPPFPGWLRTAALTVTSVSSVKTGFNPHTQSFQAKHEWRLQCSKCLDISTFTAVTPHTLAELVVFRSLHNIFAQLCNRTERNVWEMKLQEWLFHTRGITDSDREFLLKNKRNLRRDKMIVSFKIIKTCWSCFVLSIEVNLPLYMLLCFNGIRKSYNAAAITVCTEHGTFRLMIEL